MVPESLALLEDLGPPPVHLRVADRDEQRALGGRMALLEILEGDAREAVEARRSQSTRG